MVSLFSVLLTNPAFNCWMVVVLGATFSSVTMLEVLLVLESIVCVRRLDGFGGVQGAKTGLLYQRRNLLAGAPKSPANQSSLPFTYGNPFELLQNPTEPCRFSPSPSLGQYIHASSTSYHV